MTVPDGVSERLVGPLLLVERMTDDEGELVGTATLGLE